MNKKSTENLLQLLESHKRNTLKVTRPSERFQIDATTLDIYLIYKNGDIVIPCIFRKGRISPPQDK